MEWWPQEEKEVVGSCCVADGWARAMEREDRMHWMEVVVGNVPIS